MRVVAGAGFAGLLAAERGAEFVLDGYDLARAVAGQPGPRLADTAMSSYEREPRGGAATTHQETARCAEFVAAVAAQTGEHTDGAWSGPMEGALRDRAADEVLIHAVP